MGEETLQRVADALRRREDELTARMMERFAGEVPELLLGEDPEVVEAMRSSARANLRAGIAHLAAGGPPLPYGPPAEAIEEARLVAQAGLPLGPGMQTYRIGQSVMFDAALEAVEAMDDLDAAARSATLRACSQYAFAYVDAVIPAATDAYTRERDRIVRGREQRRVQLVRDLLDGADVDAGELGYDLAATHRAVVAWGAGAAEEVARLGARVLTVAVSGQTVWGWVAGEDPALEDSTVSLALGRAAPGPDGFRLSHRQARAAQRIGAATGSPVTHYDDVALESVLLADEQSAREFVAGELSALDDARDAAKLRETLTAYFASGFNAAAAAALLEVSDRTVAYRLGVIEELLGRPVRARQAELQAALRLERVLGQSSRRPSP